MLPQHWFAAEDARAAFARTLDVNALDVWTSLRQVENSFLSPTAHALREQQRTIEDITRQYKTSMIGFDSHLALTKLRLPGLAAELSGVAGPMNAAAMHSQLSGATGILGYPSKLIEIQAAITAARADLASWDHMRRISETFGLEISLERHLARIRDFGMVLRDILPEPAYPAWATHLRTSALPSVSFLAHEWAKPVGLLTGLGPELGASISWLTRHRAEPVVTMAAITPPAESNDRLRVVVDDEVRCAVCGNLMITIGSNLKWTGPRRAVWQCRVLPACTTCFATEREHPGFLYETLCDLTRPAVGIRDVIRGGGRGDGQPQGVLRLIRIEREDGNP